MLLLQLMLRDVLMCWVLQQLLRWDRLCCCCRLVCCYADRSSYATGAAITADETPRDQTTGSWGVLSHQKHSLCRGAETEAFVNAVACG